jgi:hypothetical protein
MTTSLVVERSESGCGLPPVLIFKDVHHPRWGGGRAELGSRLPHGLVARFFLQHSGEKGAHQPCEGGKLWVRGTGQLRVPRGRRVLGSSAWMASAPPPTLPPAVWLGRGCLSTARATVASCAGPPHPQLLPRRRPHRGVVQDVVRRGGGVRVLGWSCPHSSCEDGSEDLFARAGAAAIRRYGTGAQVAAIVGGALHCRGGCLRWL